MLEVEVLIRGNIMGYCACFVDTFVKVVDENRGDLKSIDIIVSRVVERDWCRNR